MEAHLTTEQAKKIIAESQGKGWRDNCPGELGERKQILGVITEYLVAKYLQIPWTAWVNTFKSPDLDYNIEVRLIGKDWFGLRVKPNDDPSRIVVGIVMEKGQELKPCRIVGWIRAGEAKQKRWLQDPNSAGKPVYLVPQSELKPISEIVDLIKKQPA